MDGRRKSEPVNRLCPNSVEVHAEVPGVCHIRGGTRQNYSKISKREAERLVLLQAMMQSALPCTPLIVLMYSQIRPRFSVQRTLKTACPKFQI